MDTNKTIKIVQIQYINQLLSTYKAWNSRKKEAFSYYKFTSYIKTRIQCHTSRYLIVHQTNHKTHNDYCLLAANIVAAINISEGHRHIGAQIINTRGGQLYELCCGRTIFYCIVDPLEKVNILTQVLSKCKWKIKCTVCDVKYSSFRRSWRIVYIVICRSLIISCIYILQQYLRGLNHSTPFCLPFYNSTWQHPICCSWLCRCKLSCTSAAIIILVI